ncbi:alpha/beta fold hydrolase [Roseateles violae]|uniref:Alpha/beta hydrolase n=1 Tax=Roseateles violae TaxID=3058042 RepID=A0ABT8DNS8_9BURK|nr:alpha/beta hydrolase [Pelomonas sp. PFR6]MDN3918690.1 alpha/beta hydrolase [Pelomonas sp. PFR6]
MDESAPFLQAAPWLGGQVQIETQWLNPAARGRRPLIVFLHEGLGSLAQWRDFPRQLCEAADCPGLVFSRPGYGRSTPRSAPWPRDYLQEQARALPAYFDALGLRGERLFLFGHSDGASLALLLAAYFPERVRGLVAMAPHLFIEPITFEGLRRARQAYEQGSLRAALRRHHADTDSAFFGWNDAWLNPDFQQWNIEADLRTLACPVLALQGIDDEYATLAQIEAIARLRPGTRLCVLAGCGHAPQREQPQRVIDETMALLAACED